VKTRQLCQKLFLHALCRYEVKRSDQKYTLEGDVLIDPISYSWVCVAATGFIQSKIAPKAHSKNPPNALALQSFTAIQDMVPD